MGSCWSWPSCCFVFILFVLRRSSVIFCEICWFGYQQGAKTMSSLSRELVFLILQFLDEEKFKETVHKWVFYFYFLYLYIYFIFVTCDIIFIFWGFMVILCWFGFIIWVIFLNRLEQESGFFFNMKYFEDEVHSGNWDEVEKYLSGFTKVDDNRYSMKIFFEIRKQKYLEALDK